MPRCTQPDSCRNDSEGWGSDVWRLRHAVTTTRLGSASRETRSCTAA